MIYWLNEISSCGSQRCMQFLVLFRIRVSTTVSSVCLLLNHSRLFNSDDGVLGPGVSFHGYAWSLGSYFISHTSEIIPWIQIFHFSGSSLTLNNRKAPFIFPIYWANFSIDNYQMILSDLQQFICLLCEMGSSIIARFTISSRTIIVVVSSYIIIMFMSTYNV